MKGGEWIMQKLLIDETNNMIKIDETEIKCVTDYKIETAGFFKKKVTLTFLADVKMVPPNRDEQGRPILPKSRAKI